MVFSKSVDKILFLYTDASRADITDSSVKRRKLRSVRPFSAVRVPNVSNLDLEKTMLHYCLELCTEQEARYNSQNCKYLLD